MKNAFKEVIKSQPNSSTFSRRNHSNKENSSNSSDWFRSEKDISKILAHFNNLIQSNNEAISSLRNEFTTRATIASVSNEELPPNFNDDQEPSYCQGPDNLMNQTYLTISKQPYSSELTTTEFNEMNILNQKLENIQLQIEAMRRTDGQNSVRLEKRFSEKGEKSEIQKALNLSKLLVVEINQIQDRFRENQKTTRIHEEKIKILEQNLSKIDQKLTSELYPKSESTSFQNSVQNSKIHQNSLLNQTLIKMFQIQLEQMTTKNFTQIAEIKEKIQENSHEKCQSQFNQVYSRVVHLESHSDQISSQTQKIFKEIKLETQTLTKQLRKQEERLKKDSQLQLFKKFDSLDKLYVKKSYFLQEKQENEAEIKKIHQNITKIQNQMYSRIEKFEKSLQATQIMLQNHNSDFSYKLNKLSEEQSEKIVETKQEIDKSLTKYAKTEAMKQFFEQENQKMQKIINSNLEQQKLVNEVLCSENILGRWLWQNQELKNGNLVSWDKEVINTLPENFRFSLERPTLIEISSGGIYKFELGFYSKKKPTIQILINGKVIMSAVNSSSYVIHHSSGKLKSIEPTEMSGLTLVDFFLIPEHSRIAIAYSGDVKGEGFMNIHRM